jgi:hypothetical protein
VSEESPKRGAHDPFAFQQLSQVPKALAFFQTYLPRECVLRIHWRTFALGKLRSVDERLRSVLPDLIFQAEWDTGQPLRFYILFEHKSSVEADTLLQLLKGMVGIYDDWVRERKQEGVPAFPLPFIFPFVLCHGESPWKLTPRFAELVAVPEALQHLLAKHTVAFEHLLLDLGVVPMDQIRGTIEIRLILGLLKAVSEGREGEWFEKIFEPAARVLQQPDVPGFVRELFQYLFQSSRTMDFSTLRGMLDKIPDERTRSDVMTLAERIFADGEQEGWLKAKQVAILDVLEARFGMLPDDLRDKVAQLTLEPELSAALRLASRTDSLSAFADQLGR